MPSGMANYGVANAVCDIIRSNCSNLLSIDLSHNEMSSLQAWTRLGSAAPELVNLSLEGNKLTSFKELDSLRSLKNVRNIVLAGNPVVMKVLSREEYEREVRRYFKSVEQIDGTVCSTAPPGLAQDGPKLPLNVKVAAEVLLNPAECVAPDPTTYQGIVNFMQKYFELLDDPKSRDQLRLMYHPDAEWNLYVPSVGYSKTSLRAFQYKGAGAAKGKKRRDRLELHEKGVIDIVSALKKLPRLSHEAVGNMALSLRDNTAVSVAFTLSGRLSEGGGKGKAKRALPRLFRRDVILQLVEAPNELGLPCLITLERLTLADDPGDAKIAQAVAAVASGSQVAVDPNDVAAVTANIPGLTQEQATMVVQIAMATKLNMVYSHQCLANNNWNFALAQEDFARLNAQGAIPAEAFLA